MSMELSELMRAVVRLQVLNSQKSDLVFKIGELESKGFLYVALGSHLREQHLGTGHKMAQHFAQQVDQLVKDVEPLRSKLNSVNAQIEQIFAEMKSKNYDPFT